jgi:hypothetical protein
MIEITAKIIKISSGKVKLTSTSSKMIPECEDFDKLGFQAAFDEYEGAVLESREQASVQLSEQYLNEGSNKKLEDAEIRLTPEGGKVKVRRFPIRTRIGSLKPNSRRLMAQEKTVYDTAEDFHKKIGSREAGSPVGTKRYHLARALS